MVCPNGLTIWARRVTVAITVIGTPGPAVSTELQEGPAMAHTVLSRVEQIAAQLASSATAIPMGTARSGQLSSRGASAQ
jgi:hypothetical protein